MFLPCCFDLRPNYGGGNKDNGALLQKVGQGPQPRPPPETPGHSQASLSQSLVGSLLLSPGSWYLQGFVFALHVSVLPVLWNFCNQILLSFKVRCPRDSQSLCKISRLRSLMSGLEPLQQLENFFGMIIFQFVGCTPAGMKFDFMVTVPLLLSLCGFSFVLGCGICFLVGSSILLLMVVQHLVVIWCSHRRR